MRKAHKDKDKVKTKNLKYRGLALTFMITCDIVRNILKNTYQYCPISSKITQYCIILPNIVKHCQVFLNISACFCLGCEIDRNIQI